MSESGAWTCPSCGRQFGRAGQGHVCAEAMALDEYFGSALLRTPDDLDADLRDLLAESYDFAE